MTSWKDWAIEQIPSKDFPGHLNGLAGMPDILYCRGNYRRELFENCLTIVGSRKITRYGTRVIERLVPAIVANKITVVSGFMYGVDITSHRQTLECGGATIAVVGGGLDKIANSYNEKLYTDILQQNGLVVSQFEPEFLPTTWSFPKRDMLMAAMSTVGVLVIEGGINSGSLITAKYAKKYGKKLMAIPGPIDSSVSEGTNWLIKSGEATMVTDSTDIFGGTAIQTSMFKDFSNLSTIEKQIIGILEREEVSMDEICQKLRLSIVVVSRAVTMLTMRDLVEEANGKIYLG